MGASSAVGHNSNRNNYPFHKKLCYTLTRGLTTSLTEAARVRPKTTSGHSSSHIHTPRATSVLMSCEPSAKVENNRRARCGLTTRKAVRGSVGGGGFEKLSHQYYEV